MPRVDTDGQGNALRQSWEWQDVSRATDDLIHLDKNEPALQGRRGLAKYSGEQIRASRLLRPGVASARARWNLPVPVLVPVRMMWRGGARGPMPQTLAALMRANSRLPPRPIRLWPSP